MRVYEIDGYWEDDPGNKLDGYLVTDVDSVGDEIDERLARAGFTDGDIFYYGVTEAQLNDPDASLDGFVVTRHTPVLIEE